MRECPVCKTSEGIREYIYGLPIEEPDESKYIFGGCLVFEDMPDYKCLKCSTDFYQSRIKYHNRFIDDGSGIIHISPSE
jgi:hypothetical protein